MTEALELCLKAQNDRKKAIRGAFALNGSMKETEAAELATRTENIRADWR